MCVMLTAGCETMRRWRALSDAPAAERLKALEKQMETLTAQIEQLEEELRFNVASNQVSLGKYEDAIKGFTEVVGRYPTSTHAASSLYEIAKMYKYNLKDYAKAKETYDNLVRRYPKSDYVRTASFEIADCLMELGRKSDALAQYRSVISKFGRDPVVEKAYFEIGEIQQQDKKFTESRVSYEKLLELFPSGALRPAAMHRLASCVLALADTATAIRNYELVYTKFPSSDFSELAFFDRLTVLVAQNMDSDARAAISDYMIRYPTGRFRAEVDRFQQKFESKKSSAP